MTCINCKNTSINFDNFLDLSLPLVKGINTLEGLLHEYFGEESLSDFYVCSKCGKSSKKSMKRSELWRCPNYLIIQLKRSQFGRKNSERIKIPVKCLNVRPFMSSSNYFIIQVKSLFLVSITCKELSCIEGKVMEATIGPILRTVQIGIAPMISQYALSKCLQCYKPMNSRGVRMLIFSSIAQSEQISQMISSIILCFVSFISL